MKTNHTFLALSVLLFSAICVTDLMAQDSNQLYFENYTVDDGLPGNFIHDITQDSLGYIWIATEGGIAKFDGYEFEIFRNIPGNPSSISDDDVANIVTDIYGNIWVDNFIGLDLYDAASNSFIRFFQDPASPDYIEPGAKISIIPSSSGSIIIGTAGNGLISYDPVKKKSKKYRNDPEDPSSISSDYVFNLHEDANGTVWFTTLTTGLNKFDPDSEIFTNITFEEQDPNRIPDNTYLTSIFVDSEQILWASIYIEDFKVEGIKKGDDAGIWQIDLKTGEYRKLLYDPIEQPLTTPIFSIIESANKTIWFAKLGPEKTKPGLYEYSKNDGSYIHHTYRQNDNTSLQSNWTEVVYQDSDGSLWVGTEMGISKTDLSRKQFRSFVPLAGDLKAPENFLNDILYVNGDIYWIGREDLPPIEWNKETGEWKTLDLHLTNTEIYLDPGMWLISNNILWIIEPPSNLLAYNITTKEIQNYSNKTIKATDYDFISLISDSNNNLWLGTSIGISKFSIKDKEFYDYPLRSKFSPDDSLAVISLIAGKEGNIWTMTIDVALDSSKEKQGVYLNSFDPASETFSNLVIDENYYNTLAHGYASNIMEDSIGDIWISKSNGLVHYNRSEEYFTWYNQNDGLSNLFANFTIQDELGKIWIATSYGISRFDPEKKAFRNFERSDGVVPLRMSSLKTLSGSIFLLGVGGMNIIDPLEIEEVSTPPKVLITGITLNGKNLNTKVPVEILEKIEIPWSESGLEIEYTAINFKAADKTTYSYKLEGFNEEFQQSSTRRYAQFTNLEPGDYTFKVNATNAEGLRSEVDTVLDIRVLPPWWKTWWAFVFYGLIFLSGALITDRLQRRRVLFKEKERAREKELKQAKKIEEAYRELEKSLQDLKAAQDQLVQQEKLASLGQLTAGIAHEIKNPLNFVNNFSELSVELIEELRDEIAEVQTQCIASQPGDIKNIEAITEILNDIETNLKKIHEHGSRADSIVKSMLEHSRGGSGKMEPTQLNALVKEFVSLTFHGMRASKTPINVELDFQLDESIGEVPLIAEDFSRVIINLCNNAFDAMREKQNSEFRILNSEEYKPKLTVRTQQTDSGISLEIEDNGHGIPEEIKDNILQPFFTTKKGTQGTGLGLSITNDIVKAHGGTMILDSQPGQTVFTIKLKG